MQSGKSGKPAANKTKPKTMTDGPRNFMGGVSPNTKRGSLPVTKTDMGLPSLLPPQLGASGPGCKSIDYMIRDIIMTAIIYYLATKFCSSFS